MYGFDDDATTPVVRELIVTPKIVSVVMCLLLLTPALFIYMSIFETDPDASAGTVYRHVDALRSYTSPSELMQAWLEICTGMILHVVAEIRTLRKHTIGSHVSKQSRLQHCTHIGLKPGLHLTVDLLLNR
jgi:hypothetical protein